ncbi:PucR family transcriptional regulator [Saccharopolyspora gloriosae]|uniref:Purine catabolism regulator n=1 Tax=Saccharopolyspora gloriosae TaxID=455344 RepID=A0A840N8I5_9PSEU|nr:PucR family transcriptional regulator [Saccharopolyspora gloriosae]MBB5068280.1 purine catabolism regulator [Saccharopolyspora gloriosae]
MVLTLADVVAIPGLALRTVVEPATPRALGWVTTSELADPAQYLEGGELLLTTGLAAQDWAAYVERIDRAGVAALGFGTGLSHADVPPDLVAAARAAGLGLVVVPESTPFIAIGKAVAGLLAERERTATETALAVQQELTRVISRADGPARALGVLGRAARGSAGLVDVDGKALVPARFRVPDAALRALATLRAGTGRSAATESGAEGTTVVQPLGRGVDGPFLVLVSPGALDGVLRAVLVSTVALLTLDAERSRAAADAELRLRDRAATLVLDGAVDAGTSVAAMLNCAPVVPRSLRVLRATGIPDGARARLARDHPEVLTAATSDAGIALVVDADAAVGAGELADLLAALGARVGIGPAVPARDAGTSDAAAGTALSLADGGSPVVGWDERFRGEVRAALPDHAARALAASILGELVDEPELLRTLRSYLTHLGRWQPTADDLGIHRNTLRKRIAAIERLTGRGVDTAAGRADLWIAVVSATEPPG